MSIKTKLIKISNFIDNFCKLAGVQEQEFKRILDLILNSVNEFEDVVDYDDNIDETKKGEIYSDVQYVASLAILYIKTGFGFIKLRDEFNKLGEYLSKLTDINSKTLDYASIVHKTIFQEILSPNKLEFRKSFAFKSQHNYINEKIETLKDSNNYYNQTKLIDMQDIFNEISSIKASDDNVNQEAKTRAIEETSKKIENKTEEEEKLEILKENLPEFYQDQEGVLFEEDQSIVDKELPQTFTEGLAETNDKYRNEIKRDLANEDAMDQEFTKSLAEVSQKNSEDENTGVRTFNVGQYDNGIGQLERTKANTIVSKEKIDQLILVSQEQIKDFSSGKKKNETLVLTINEKLNKYKESSNLYNQYLNLIDKELNVRKLINEKENKFVTELKTVFDNASITQLEEDRKIYFEVQSKIKAIKARKKETAISKEELNELKILQEKAKISKSKYDVLIKNKKEQINNLVENRLQELDSKYQGNDPTKYEEEEAIKKTGVELIQLKDQINKLTQQKNQFVIDRGNLNANILKKENELWLETEGKNVKDPTKSPFKKENYFKAIRKIKALTQVDKKKKSLNIISEIDSFLKRDSSSEKDIVEFYNKIVEKFNSRPIASSYIWSKDLEDDIYKKVDILQKDITTIITNTFFENIPSKDEAFLNFVGMDNPSQQKFKSEMDKYLLQIAEMQASSTVEIKEQYGEESTQYRQALNELYKLIETNTKFSKALEFLINKQEDGKNQFDRLSPHKLKFDSIKKLIETTNSIMSYKRYISENKDKFKNLMTRNAEIQKIKIDLQTKYARYQQLMDKLKIENIGLYEETLSFNSELVEVYENAILALDKIPSSEGVKLFKGKASLDMMQKASRFFMSEAKKLILDHIVRYKQSAEISQVNNIYYHWKNLNDKVIAVKAIISNIEKIKKSLNKQNKDLIGLDDIGKRKILLDIVSKDATKQVLYVFGEENESSYINLSVRIYLNKIRDIANDILENQEYVIAGEAMQSDQVTNCISKIINTMIEVLSYIEEYGE